VIANEDSVIDVPYPMSDLSGASFQPSAVTAVIKALM
jgi:hypothetical protein